MVTTNSLNINASGVVSFNSTTGVFSESALTQHDVLVGSSSNAITSVAPGTAGFVLTSNGASADPSFQVSPAALTWTDVTSGTQTIAAGTGYVTDNATQVTYTLPATPAFGNIFEITGGVSGASTAPWIIAQNAGQQINFGNSSTTVGTGGSIASTLKYDSVRCVCIVAGASAVWNVLSSVGNLVVT